VTHIYSPFVGDNPLGKHSTLNRKSKGGAVPVKKGENVKCGPLQGGAPPRRGSKKVCQSIDKRPCRDQIESYFGKAHAPYGEKAILEKNREEIWQDQLIHVTPEPWRKSPPAFHKQKSLSSGCFSGVLKKRAKAEKLWKKSHSGGKENRHPKDAVVGKLRLNKRGKVLCWASWEPMIFVLEEGPISVQKPLESEKGPHHRRGGLERIRSIPPKKGWGKGA